MAYDGTKSHFTEERERDVALRVLEALVGRYIANIGTKGEFVACITPSGPMKEWEQAKSVLRSFGQLPPLPEEE